MFVLKTRHLLTRFATAVRSVVGPAVGPVVWLTIGLAVISVSGVPAAAQDAGADTVAVGDKVSITIYGEPDLNVKEAKVRRSGVVPVPLIGNVAVVGRTATEITRQVTAMLLDGYLRKPSVTVDVEKFNLYYIKGEVRNPGGYRFVDGLSIEKAIALAGGVTERAAETDVRLARSGQTQPVAGISPTTELSPGDVITVGESFF
jgi:protein involved in polysaccharide export with SLBB domain